MKNILPPFKNKKISFQSRLLAIMIIDTLLLVVSIFVYGYLNEMFPEQWVYIKPVTSIVLLIVFGGTIRVFYKKVYIPIMKIEKALEILENNETDFKLEVEKEISPILDSLSKMLNRMKDSMDREHATQMLKRQSELSALQNQINPHFLYNTLEAIRGEALIHDNIEIANMTEAIARFFRYSISNKGDFVTVREELDNVKNYILIQQYRFDDKIEFQVIYDEVDESDMRCLLPKLTVQPIVENSIYHGLETKLGKGEITIRVTVTQERLLMSISDNGLGIEQEKLDQLNQKLRYASLTQATEESQKHSGIALINVDQRLKLYFGEDYGISISSTVSIGTDVEIVLPKVKDMEEIHKMRYSLDEKRNLENRTRL